MDWKNISMILTQVIKGFDVKKCRLPVIAITIGGALGALFGAYYQVDYLEHIASGIVYGASAAGLYRLGEAATRGII